jgi:hypothetical protein
LFNQRGEPLGSPFFVALPRISDVCRQDGEAGISRLDLERIKQISPQRHKEHGVKDPQITRIAQISAERERCPK